MGKELPMAREEEEGRSVLLASTSSGESITTSSSGDQRTQESDSAEVSKRGKVKDTKTESKVSRKAKRTNARPRRQRHRRDNKDREQDRGDEGKDSKPRRCASELGITYPGSYCDDAKITPHYWVEIEKVSKGSLYQCILCHRHLWLPLLHTDSNRLGSSMQRLGKNEGYCHYLNRNRPAKLLMAKLQDLRRLEGEIDDKIEFAKMTDKILSDMEYDRKEI